MKKTVKILFSTVLCLSLVSGCSMIDFSEDCSYTGDVEVIFDWERLLDGDQKPGLMQTVFYPGNSALSSFMLAGDTLLKGLAATRHDVLSYNHPAGITFHETDCPCTAYATAGTYTKDGKSYVTNVPALYAAKTDIVIPAFEGTRCVLTPQPCFQQVFISFVIIRSNVDAEVESLSGELGGVATMYSLGDMAAMQSEASLSFEGKQTAEDNYHTALRVLGMSPAASKGLDVHLLLDNGDNYRQSLDLTGVFENFTAPAIYLTIEIYLSHAGITLSIADWYTGEGGNIEL